MNWGQRLARFGDGYPVALGAVALTLVVAFPLRPYLAPAAIMLIFVPVILALARFVGLRASTVAAVVAFFAINFLFVPPYYRFTVAQPSEWIALVVFLIIAIVAGQQTAKLRGRERGAVRRQGELEFLNRLSFRVVSEESSAATSQFIVEKITRVLGAARAAIYSAEPGEANAPIAEAGDGSRPDDHRAFVEWVLANAKAVGLEPALAGQPESPASVPVDKPFKGLSAVGVYLPLQTSESLEGVLHVEFGPESEPASDQRILVSVASLAAAALQRRRLEDEAAQTRALVESDRLKSTFISTISHELKTPLAAATARVTDLTETDQPYDPERIDAELRAIADDLGRLNDSIGNLLDLARLEADAWRPSLEPCDVSDILGTALSRLAPAERSRITFELDPDVPPACVDFGQMVSAIRNVLENALTYAPAGTPVSVSSGIAGGEILVRVADLGPGIPDAEKESVFDKFYRGASSGASPKGTGLGLPIAREIVTANGGRLWAEDGVPTGAVFVVALPAEGPCEVEEGA